MKVSREDIQYYDIQGYIDWLIKMPSNLISDISELERLKEREKTLIIRSWKWHSYFLNAGKVSIHYEKYKKIYSDTMDSLKNEIRDYEKSEDLLLPFALGTEIEDLQIENGVVVFKKNKECIDLIINSNILKNAAMAEKVIEMWYNSCWEALEENEFNNRRREREILKYEQEEFSVMDYLETKKIDSRIYSDKNFDICKDLAELLFYKELVVNNEPKNIEKNVISMVDKLKMLKEVGVFELPYFSVDPRTSRVSEREQSRFLSKLLGYNETNIRNKLKEIR